MLLLYSIDCDDVKLHCSSLSTRKEYYTEDESKNKPISVVKVIFSPKNKHSIVCLFVRADSYSIVDNTEEKKG